MRLPAFSKFFNQKRMTGIDIQPEGVQFVQLRHNKQAFVLEKIAVYPLEVGVFTEGKVSDWDKLTALLYDWVRELDLVGAVSAAALPMQAIKLLRVDKPPVLTESWLWDYLEHALPGLGETVIADHCLLLNEAMLVAVAKREDVENYTSCLQEAGLALKIMDIDLFAIQRATQCFDKAILWQQRNTFTLIAQDEQQLPQQWRWPVTYGEQAIAQLSQRLQELKINELLFCGSSYYCELFKKISAIRYFTPQFSRSSINMPDYLLAIGLAQREVPLW